MKQFNRLLKISFVVCSCFFLNAGQKMTVPEKKMLPAEIKAVENFQRIDKLILRVDSLIYKAESLD